MENIFITKINIKKVRHLENVTIDLHETEKRHLILTGKNGSGKTSLLEEMARYWELRRNSSYGDNISIHYIPKFFEYDK